MKILIYVDRLNDWAIHNHAKALKKFLPQHEIEIRGMNVGDPYEGHEHFDVLHFTFTWGLTDCTEFILANANRCVITVVNERSLLTGGGVNPSQLTSIFHACRHKTGLNRNICRMIGAEYIPNGIDEDIFPAPRQLIVGYSGTDILSKNIQVTESVCKTFGYTFKPALDRREHGSGRDYSHERMAEYYRSIDVFVHSSLTEGFNNSVLEACACNVPVLMTKQGAWEDFEGWVDFIEPTFDGIANGLKKFSARELVTSKFLWANVVPCYEQVYYRVVDG